MIVTIILLTSSLIFAFGLIHRLYQTIAKVQRQETQCHSCEIMTMKEFYQNQVKALTEA